MQIDWTKTAIVITINQKMELEVSAELNVFELKQFLLYELNLDYDINKLQIYFKDILINDPYMTLSQYGIQNQKNLKLVFK
ncbi:Ubiquitin-like_domain superfamily [Hexamita inflata]|uniref:Ubiquitin-like domain superfamily n=1 Tax=Hexamita inflata TaxID=28002 RepID=A0AA86PN97_9EUKA|nr:Ubiquitin-like domain superfamily [Hexamita inflata]